MTRQELEARLNDFDASERTAALDALCDLVARGDVTFPEPRPVVNLHYHTFFSFNGYGYSPSFIAWRARCEGLWMVGCIDFDVLDAVDEFLAACRKLGLRACGGMETRVYVPSFATRVINSPGEPGIAYYIGVGFTSSASKDPALLAELKAMAQQRNRGIMTRANPYLSPVTLEYERDVLPLTPKGNATERHLCTAYDTRSRELIPDADKRAAFWAGKLGVNREEVKALLDDPPAFQGLIRAKTMKAGGVGYVQPEGPDFPDLGRVSRFILDAGAIPAYGFVDGLSEGEQTIEELLDVAAEQGAAALNIIPDRNWNVKDPGLKRAKVARLHEVVELVRARDLPIVVGTEMNAYGQKFVDDFDAPALKPLVPAFLEGAAILYAHTVLQSRAGMGYLSEWAASRFASVGEKNAFFKELGERIEPRHESTLSDITPDDTPNRILSKVRSMSETEPSGGT